MQELVKMEERFVTQGKSYEDQLDKMKRLMI